MDLRRAVVVDQWALVRVGIGTILRNLSIRVAGDASQAQEGLALCRSENAQLVVLGSHLDVSVAHAVMQAKLIDPDLLVVSLLAEPDAEALGAVLTAGADAVLLRAATDQDLSNAVTKIATGERFLAPALTLLLAGAVSQTSDPSPLTAKETQVLAGLAAGRTNKDLAEELYVSAATIKTHLSHIYTKLGAKNRREALARAVEMGLLA